MSLTRADVAHVAALCKIALSDAEEARMVEQLTSILEHVNRLREVDTSAVEPTASGFDLLNVQRPDRVTPSLPPESVLANAPDQDQQQFRVPAILEEG